MKVRIEIKYQITDNSELLHSLPHPEGLIRAYEERLFVDCPFTQGNAEYIIERDTEGQAVDYVAEYYKSKGWDVLCIVAYQFDA